MGKREGLSVGEKKTCVLTNNNILMQENKILPTISPFYRVNTSVGVVLEIFSEEK
jgi:hypothetical protein